MFKAIIATSAKTLFEGQVESVFLPGLTGEFEVLAFHKPIMSLLKEGRIIIDGSKEIPIKRGAVRMSGDELAAIVEEKRGSLS